MDRDKIQKNDPEAIQIPDKLRDKLTTGVFVDRRPMICLRTNTRKSSQAMG
jgi:hypothetical protein